MNDFYWAHATLKGPLYLGGEKHCDCSFICRHKPITRQVSDLSMSEHRCCRWVTTLGAMIKGVPLERIASWFCAWLPIRKPQHGHVLIVERVSCNTLFLLQWPLQEKCVAATLPEGPPLGEGFFKIQPLKGKVNYKWYTSLKRNSAYNITWP